VIEIELGCRSFDDKAHVNPAPRRDIGVAFILLGKLRPQHRHETRTTTVFDAAATICAPEWRDAVTTIIRVERVVQAFQPATGMWKRSGEISYYLSNRTIEAEQAGEAIRQHWHIENRSHHVRDVTLGEDASRIRRNPGVFARLRSFAANILRFNQASSVRQDRYAAALAGFDQLAKLRFNLSTAAQKSATGRSKSRPVWRTPGGLA
jgi:predicted transposase YbfD/YdcC